MQNALLVCGAVWLLAATLAAPLHAAEGDWFLAAGKQQPSTSNPRHAAYQKLLERSQAGRPLVSLAFTPNDEWVALCGGTESWSSETDLPVCAKIQELHKDPAVRELHGVAFSPTGGWVLLYDRNRFVAEGIPDGAARKLRALADTGAALRAVVFPPAGGWIILGGANGVFADGIPDALTQVLTMLVKKSARVTGITFNSAGDWFIVTDGDGQHARRPEHPAAKALAEAGAARWLAFAPGDSPTGYVLSAVPSRRIRAVLTTTIAMPDAAVEEWYVYAPHAPTFAGQRDVKTSLTPDGQVVRELSPLERPLLLSRVKGRAKELQPVLTIDATLVARRLLPRPSGSAAPAVPELSADQARLYTRSTPSLDPAAPPFVDWLERHELRRGKNEPDIAFARRVYSFIKHHFEYDSRTAQDLRPAAVCRAGKSDCGGLSALFVAALRAGGIPARMLQGRWAQSEKRGDQLGGAAYKQWHVKSEFFARGVGWVPVDMAGAITHPQRGEFACFGNDLGDFVTLHLDHDIVLSTFVAGTHTVFGMQAHAYWWRGTGSAKGTRAEQTWRVERVAE